MKSYSYIESLFRNVLVNSSTIGGRFYVTPKYGVEINNDEVGSLIDDEVKKVVGQKYPLALMMPPRSSGTYTDPKGDWDQYRIVMFFLTTSFYASNQITAVNINTQTSTQPIPKDWEAMKVAAVDFIRVLDKLIRKRFLADQIRVADITKIIDPVSGIGMDRASGVRLDFNISIFLGCTIEDYSAEGIDNIIIPS